MQSVLDRMDEETRELHKQLLQKHEVGSCSRMLALHFITLARRRVDPTVVGGHLRRRTREVGRPGPRHGARARARARARSCRTPALLAPRRATRGGWRAGRPPRRRRRTRPRQPPRRSPRCSRTSASAPTASWSYASTPPWWARARVRARSCLGPRRFALRVCTSSRATAMSSCVFGLVAVVTAPRTTRRRCSSRRRGATPVQPDYDPISENSRPRGAFRRRRAGTKERFSKCNPLKCNLS